MERLQPIQQQIVAGNVREARVECEALLAEHPDNEDILYMLAVCQRLARDFEDALSTLETLQRVSPENGRAYQEEGHTWRDAGQPASALRAYELACRFNPALLAAWRERLNIHRSRGENTPQIQQQFDHLSALSKPVLAVMDLVSQGRILKAEELCRQVLQQQPTNTEAMRLLADIGMRLGILDDAEFLLESALEFEPGNRTAHIEVLRKRQKFEAARKAAADLLATDESNPQFQSLYAIESMQSGDYETALDMFGRILDRIPGEPATLTSRGHALKTIGRADEAVTAYHDAIRSNPNHGEAYYSLANLKTYRFDEAEIAAMQACLTARGQGHQDRVYLNFALGKAMEDNRDHAQAMHYYADGNALKKAQSRYRADQISEEFEQQKKVCTPEVMARRFDAGYPAPDPVFIVGLPRAGSTLLEQILSSHSQVDGTLELPNILSYTSELRRGERIASLDRYPAVLSELPDEKLGEYGKRFIEETRIHRQGAPFFIDKMPNNFRHIGFIKLILPNARIIDARRHPMSCCVSGYKQLFAEGQEFSYDLADVGRYFRDYVSLMSHWHEVLPGEILTVRHEQVVDDLESSVREILDFCGLPFEESCINFFETERNVRTPSSEQVRQPIFREGLDAWKPFEPWLDPLKDALGEDICREYGIETATRDG